MPCSDDLRAIYAQRYQTFRHLDSLRWQVPTISLTGGGIMLGMSASSGSPLPPWWAFAVLSVMLVLSCYAVYRIRQGIHKNSEVLITVALQVGDTEIPPPTRFGATWWLVAFLAAMALVSLSASVLAFMSMQPNCA